MKKNGRPVMTLVHRAFMPEAHTDLDLDPVVSGEGNELMKGSVASANEFTGIAVTPSPDEDVDMTKVPNDVKPAVGTPIPPEARPKM